MKRLALLVAIVASFALIANGYALQVLEPNDAGCGAPYGGGGYFPMVNAFDSSANSYNAGTGTMTGTDTGPVGAPYYAGRWGQIDLGANFANLRIKECWTLWRPWSGDFNNPHLGYTEGFFTNIDAPNLSWPGPFGNPDQVVVDMNKINFHSGTIPHVGTYEWVKDTDAGANEADWVTPTGRYLEIKYQAVANDDRASEYAIVGYVVPEPATMVLLAMGGLGMLLRRRRA